MNYLRFEFEAASRDQAEKLIALLAEQGFEGFEENEDTLDAFIAEHRFNETAFLKVIDLFTELAYTRTVVENINWNKKWEAEFRPVIIDDFVAVRASFHPPVSTVQHDLLITPKMSFGTGHHPTTYLVVSVMRQLEFKDKTVLDFGTGTGILAILACKLGAKEVVAIDYDDWSINNAIENAAANACSNIKVLKLDAFPLGEKYDIILANINLNVIVDNLSSIALSSGKGAKILLSGILKENEAALVDAIRESGLNYLSTIQRNDWIVVMAGKD